MVEVVREVLPLWSLFGVALSFWSLLRGIDSLWSWLGGLFGVAQAFGGVEFLKKLHHQSACWKHKEVYCEFVLSLSCFSSFLPLLEVVCSGGCIVFAKRVLKWQGVSLRVRFE